MLGLSGSILVFLGAALLVISLAAKILRRMEGLP
jgi:hypothetical protein